MGRGKRPRRAPEDIAKLVRHDERLTRTRERDLRRFFRDLSARNYYYSRLE